MSTIPEPDYEFLPPENFNVPELTTQKETDEILKLITSGIIKTHSNKFNSLDIRIINTFQGFQHNYNIDYSGITDPSSFGLEVIEKINLYKNYLIDEMIPTIDSGQFPINIENTKRQLQIKITDTIVFEGIEHLQVVSYSYIKLIDFLKLVTGKENTSEIISSLEMIQDHKISSDIFNLKIPENSLKILNYFQEAQALEKTLIQLKDLVFEVSQKELDYVLEHSSPKLFEKFSTDLIYTGIFKDDLISFFEDLKLQVIFDLAENQTQEQIENYINTNLKIKRNFCIKPIIEVED